MKGHIATIHEGKKPFKCDICNVNFGQKVGLKKHVATVHEGKKHSYKKAKTASQFLKNIF